MNLPPNIPTGGGFETYVRAWFLRTACRQGRPTFWGVPRPLPFRGHALVRLGEAVGTGAFKGGACGASAAGQRERARSGAQLGSASPSPPGARPGAPRGPPEELSERLRPVISSACPVPSRRNGNGRETSKMGRPASRHERCLQVQGGPCDLEAARWIPSLLLSAVIWAREQWLGQRLGQRLGAKLCPGASHCRLMTWAEQRPGRNLFVSFLSGDQRFVSFHIFTVEFNA